MTEQKSMTMKWRVEHPAYKPAEFAAGDEAALWAYVETICEYLARKQHVIVRDLEDGSTRDGYGNEVLAGGASGA